MADQAKVGSNWGDDELDAIAYGRDLIPLVRDLVAAREARPVRAAG